VDECGGAVGEGHEAAVGLVRRPRIGLRRREVAFGVDGADSAGLGGLVGDRSVERQRGRDGDREYERRGAETAMNLVSMRSPWSQIAATAANLA
jgi:hypothetical protein